MNKTDLIAARLLELAAECIQLASTIREQDKSSGFPIDELLSIDQVAARYGMGRVALDSRGIPKARYGRAYKWRVSDIERAILAEPPKPRARRCVEAALEDEDPLDFMLRTGVLV